MKSRNVPITHSNLESDEFRKIKSLEFLYEINYNGTIFRNVKSKKQLKITLDFHHSEKGYYFVWPHVKGKLYRRSVHSLVAECWLGDKPDGYEIDHIDRNSHNNDYRNLRYVTKSQQMKNRDHANISIQGTQNCLEWVESVKKPVTISGPISKTFESITACARWMAERYHKKVEHFRYKLKKRRSHIYEFDIQYL